MQPNPVEHISFISGNTSRAAIGSPVVGQEQIIPIFKITVWNQNRFNGFVF